MQQTFNKDFFLMADVALILPAAGRSTRFGDPGQKKIYADLDGQAVWLRSVQPFLNRDDISEIILAIHEEDRELFDRRYSANVAFLGIKVITGGAERHDTVAMALEHLSEASAYVAVHDAARPCVNVELIDSVIAAARQFGAAIPAVPVADTLKRGDADGMIVETVSRAGLFGVQTPQIFKRELITQAYARKHEQGAMITDDAQLVEALGHPVKLVVSSAMNIKITTAADLKLASAILKVLPIPKREGPAHPFADERTMQ